MTRLFREHQCVGIKKTLRNSHIFKNAFRNNQFNYPNPSLLYRAIFFASKLSSLHLLYIPFKLFFSLSRSLSDTPSRWCIAGSQDNLDWRSIAWIMLEKFVTDKLIFLDGLYHRSTVSFRRLLSHYTQ